MKKWIRNTIGTIVLSTIILFQTTHIMAGAYVLYEKTTTEAISKGVTFYAINQVTDEGLRDIYILKVPTKDPNIQLNNTLSAKDFDYKETTSALLNDHGAIAGVNADFFNMKGSYSQSQGPSVVSGDLVTADRLNNMDKKEYATFYVTEDGTPFMNYVQTKIHFLNNGEEHLKIHYLNKVPNVIYPVLVNRKAMQDTTSVDQQFANIYKIVVSGDKVTYISQKGETVQVPEDGYVILLNEEAAEYFLTVIHVGDTTDLSVEANIDYDAIQTTVGGGGLILKNGEVVHDTGFVPGGRQPRTAIGINEDRSEVILVVVDGRTHSIGATQEEMASILSRFGAVEGMHFDGGGSSTMAVKEPDGDQAKTVNTPSDGSERKVYNAIGVYNQSEKGAMDSIQVKLKSDSVMVGVGTPYQVIGYDTYLNKVEVNTEDVHLSSNDEGGKFANGLFYPSRSGEITITATLNEFTAQMKVHSAKLAEITSGKQKIDTVKGAVTPLEFNGKTVDGYRSYIYDGLTYKVVPAELGTIQDGNFTAAKEGAGYIEARLQDVVTYVPVSVGLKSEPITSFESALPISYTAYPENLTGSVAMVNDPVAEGTSALKLSYQFQESESTQAAYFVFNNGLALPGTPDKIGLSVFGDNSQNWLRVKIMDKNQQEYLVTLAERIDWTGYRTLSAKIPDGVAYPVTIDRIYIASTRNFDTTPYTLYFDQLTADFPTYGNVKLPDGTKFYDVAQKALPGGNGKDITVVGDLNTTNAKKPDNYVKIQEKAIAALGQNTARGLFAGSNDYKGAIAVPTYQWGPYYALYRQDAAGILYLDNSKGSFYGSNIEQWGKFYNDIVNSEKKFIVIETALNPLTMKGQQEFQLLHNALVELNKQGIQIYFISTEGNKTTSTVKDGIRYINLGGLFLADNNVNPDFRVLRFRMDGEQVSYDLQKVF